MKSGIIIAITLALSSHSLVLAITNLQQNSPTSQSLDGPIEALVQEASGEEYKATLQAVVDGGVDLSREGMTSTLDFETLRSIRIESNSEIENIQESRLRIQLTDGSTLAAEEVSLDGELLKFQSTTGRHELQAGHVKSIRIGELKQEQLQSWQSYLDEQANSDILIVKQPSGALTKIDGIVLTISSARIEFEFGGTKLPVPFDRLAGVRFFSGEAPPQTGAAGSITDLSGSTLLFSKLAAAPTRRELNTDRPTEKSLVPLQVELLCGSMLELSWSDIRNIDFALGSRQYLAELEVLRKSGSTVFDFEASGLDTASVFGMRVVPARILPGDKTGPGLEFLGSGEAVFAVPPGFSSFIGKVELKPMGSHFTSCTVEIYAERKLIWSCQLSKPNRRESFQVPVEQDQRLRLVVNANSSLPSGDVVFWHEPTLQK